MPPTPLPSLRAATGSKAEHAASFWSRLQTAAAPGALVLAALSLTPLGPRMGSALLDGLARLGVREAAASVAHEVPAAEPGLVRPALLSPGDLVEPGAAWAPSLVAAGLLGAIPGLGAPLPAPPVVPPLDPPPVVEPPVVGELPELPLPEPGELPVGPELLDSLDDLGVPTVDDIGRVAEAVVAMLPAPVGDALDGVAQAVGEPVDALVDGVSDALDETADALAGALDDVLDATPVDALVDDALSEIVEAPALDLLSGLVPSDFGSVAAAPARVIAGVGDPLAGPAAAGDDLSDAVGGLDDLTGGVGDLDDGLGDTLGDLDDGLGDTLGDLDDGLGDLTDSLLDDGLGDALLDDGLLDDGLGDGLFDDDGVVDSIGDTAGDLLGGLL